MSMSTNPPNYKRGLERRLRKCLGLFSEAEKAEFLTHIQTSSPIPFPFLPPGPPPSNQPQAPKPYLLTTVCPPRILKQAEITSTSYNDFFNVDGGDMLTKKVCVIGQGPSFPTPGAQLWIRYAIYFMHPGNRKKWKLVEWSGKDPISFILFRPKPQAIPAFEYSLSRMIVGEEAFIKSCSEYIREEQAEFPKIPASSGCCTLFLLQLVDFVDYPESVLPFDTDELTPQEKSEKKFYAVKNIADAMKLLANERFKQGDYNGSLQWYYKAAMIMKRLGDLPESCKAIAHSLCFNLFNNMTSCALMQEDYELALFFGDVCLNCAPDTFGKWHKLYYRMAKASFELGKLFDAKEYCIQSLKLERDNAECRQLFQMTLHQLHEDYEQVTNILHQIELNAPKETTFKCVAVKSCFKAFVQPIWNKTSNLRKENVSGGNTSCSQSNCEKPNVKPQDCHNVNPSRQVERLTVKDFKHSYHEIHEMVAKTKKQKLVEAEHLTAVAASGLSSENKPPAPVFKFKNDDQFHLHRSLTPEKLSQILNSLTEWGDFSNDSEQTTLLSNFVW